MLTGLLYSGIFMRTSMIQNEMELIFHLAFPVHDFKQASYFYCDILGCKKGRQSSKAMILDFYGHQLVAHLVEEMVSNQNGIYPRHFGLIFREKSIFDALVIKLKERGIAFEVPLKKRFKQTPLAHDSFFLKDPSNNLLEFKYYTNEDAIFGETDYHRIGESQ
tara:strand:+ start:242 stop:730 length:489 start_codon:yes stop_codon:yes gene_type:complete